jgi:hypothetical protein
MYRIHIIKANAWTPTNIRTTALAYEGTASQVAFMETMVVGRVDSGWTNSTIK